MSFWIKPSETEFDRLIEAAEKHPSIQSTLQELHEDRQEQNKIVGPGNVGLAPPGSSSWLKIATFRLPVDMVQRVIEPGWIKDKRTLYRFLDKHPRWCTYDRRAALARRPFFGWRAEESNGSEIAPDAHE